MVKIWSVISDIACIEFVWVVGGVIFVSNPTYVGLSCGLVGVVRIFLILNCVYVTKKTMVTMIVFSKLIVLILFFPLTSKDSLRHEIIVL